MGRSRRDHDGPRLSPDRLPRPRGAPDGTATAQGCPQTAPRGRGLPQEADEDPGAWRGGAIPTPSRSPSHHGARLADVRLVNGEMPARANPNGKLPPWYPKPPWKRKEIGGSIFAVPRHALADEDPGAWRGGAIPTLSHTMPVRAVAEKSTCSLVVLDRLTPSRSPSRHGARLADIRRQRRSARPGGLPLKTPTLVSEATPAEGGAPKENLLPGTRSPPGRGGMGGRPSPRLATLFPKSSASAIARQGGPPRETSILMLFALAVTLSLGRACVAARQRDYSRCSSIPSHRDGARKPPWRGGLGGRSLNPKRE